MQKNHLKPASRCSLMTSTMRVYLHEWRSCLFEGGGEEGEKAIETRHVLVLSRAFKLHQCFHFDHYLRRNLFNVSYFVYVVDTNHCLNFPKYDSIWNYQKKIHRLTLLTNVFNCRLVRVAETVLSWQRPKI